VAFTEQLESYQNLLDKLCGLFLPRSFVIVVNRLDLFFYQIVDLCKELLGFSVVLKERVDCLLNFLVTRLLS
jgi:hypothetical protein